MNIIHPFPEFLAYLSTPPGMLIVTANKCASRYLDEYLFEKHKFKKLKISNDSSNDILHNESIYKKIFIYRAPIDRFIAWYNMFVYDQFGNQEEYGNPYMELYTAAYKHLSFRKGMIENILFLLKQYTIDELQNLIKFDTHTTPLITYFEYTGFSPDEYHILDMYDLSHFTLDKLGGGSSALPNKKIIITPESIDMLQEINYIINKVYEDDYKILRTRVKSYDG